MVVGGITSTFSGHTLTMQNNLEELYCSPVSWEPAAALSVFSVNTGLKLKAYVPISHLHTNT